MTDAEMIDCLGAALVGHPAWPEPLRVNVFALGVPDAREAVRETWGAEARIITLLFRRDVLASVSAAGGGFGYWVTDGEGFEMFVISGSEGQALSMFKVSTGKTPRSCVGSDLVESELARMNAALDGTDLAPLASKAFLSKVAAL